MPFHILKRFNDQPDLMLEGKIDYTDSVSVRIHRQLPENYQIRFGGTLQSETVGPLVWKENDHRKTAACGNILFSLPIVAMIVIYY
jgi:hypothetical protein